MFSWFGTRFGRCLADRRRGKLRKHTSVKVFQPEKGKLSPEKRSWCVAIFAVSGLLFAFWQGGGFSGEKRCNLSSSSSPPLRSLRPDSIWCSFKHFFLTAAAAAARYQLTIKWRGEYLVWPKGEFSDAVAYLASPTTLANYLESSKKREDSVTKGVN